HPHWPFVGLGLAALFDLLLRRLHRLLLPRFKVMDREPPRGSQRPPGSQIAQVLVAVKTRPGVFRAPGFLPPGGGCRWTTPLNERCLSASPPSRRSRPLGLP